MPEARENSQTFPLSYPEQDAAEALGNGKEFKDFEVMEFVN